MALDLFAGIPVSDYARALLWYERLLGSTPTFVASATEAVWELAEHRSVVIEERPGCGLIKVGHHNVGALLGQAGGTGSADTVCSTGDYHRSADEASKIFLLHDWSLPLSSSVTLGHPRSLRLTAGG